MAGRKPKPTAIKELEGNPGKRKLNKKEPKPDKEMPVCPEWLLPEAKAEWERLCEKLSDSWISSLSTDKERTCTWWICNAAGSLQHRHSIVTQQGSC